MRLNVEEVETIRATLSPVLQGLKDAQVWLFGSQLDDQARGGDVDLLVMGDEAPPLLRSQLLGWASALEEQLHMPVDLVVHSLQSLPPAVVRHALQTGVRLL